MLAALVAAWLLGAALAACARPDPDPDPDPLAGFAAPRALRLAPDGRLLVTDLGTGSSDGRVVAVDLADGRREVLLDRLPSTRGSGPPVAVSCSRIRCASPWSRGCRAGPGCRPRTCRSLSSIPW